MKTLVADKLEQASELTRVASRWIAWLLGALLLVTIFFITSEVVTRKLFNFSFRFVHEYSGYMLAILSSWGLAHTLFERAHIRIDILYAQSPAPLKRVMDLLAILSMCLTALAISYFGYPVLARSLTNGSLANTALSTPLWIPHLLWITGYFWFSLAATLLALRALFAIITGDSERVRPCISADFSESDAA
ncbi:MAG: TRAP transporter small permease subunit [Saccharospirillum sp.]